MVTVLAALLLQLSSVGSALNVLLMPLANVNLEMVSAESSAGCKSRAGNSPQAPEILAGLPVPNVQRDIDVAEKVVPKGGS